MSKSLEEIECDLRRDLYAQQAARRDAVRSTIAVPLAILGFAAFGFNGLTATALFSSEQPVLAFLSAFALAGSVFAVFFFLWALSAGTRLRYNPRTPQPQIFNLPQQEKDIFADLQKRYSDPAEIQRRGRAAIWKALSREYARRTSDLERMNEANLDTQAEMLTRLLFGLGCLILSIVLYIMVRLLMQYYFGIPLGD